MKDVSGPEGQPPWPIETCRLRCVDGSCVLCGLRGRKRSWNPTESPESEGNTWEQHSPSAESYETLAIITLRVRYIFNLTTSMTYCFFIKRFLIGNSVHSIIFCFFQRIYKWKLGAFMVRVIWAAKHKKRLIFKLTTKWPWFLFFQFKTHKFPALVQLINSFSR